MFPFGSITNPPRVMEMQGPDSRDLVIIRNPRRTASPKQKAKWCGISVEEKQNEFQFQDSNTTPFSFLFRGSCTTRISNNHQIS
jgi:hypothetical protein